MTNVFDEKSPKIHVLNVEAWGYKLKQDGTWQMEYEEGWLKDEPVQNWDI